MMSLLASIHHRDSSLVLLARNDTREIVIYVAAGFSLRILTHPKGCGYIGYVPKEDACNPKSS